MALSARADVLLVRETIAEPGRYYHDLRTIVLRKGLTLCEERQALWHELVHADRGDRACHTDERVESAVDREAARRALPVPALVSAFERSASYEDAVEWLKVPDDWIRFRLHGLTHAGQVAVRAAAHRWDGA